MGHVQSEENVAQHVSIGTNCGELGSYFLLSFGQGSQHVYNLSCVMRGTNALLIFTFTLQLNIGMTTGGSDNKEVETFLSQFY